MRHEVTRHGQTVLGNCSPTMEMGYREDRGTDKSVNTHQKASSSQELSQWSCDVDTWQRLL